MAINIARTKIEKKRCLSVLVIVLSLYGCNGLTTKPMLDRTPMPLWTETKNEALSLPTDASPLLVKPTSISENCRSTIIPIVEKKTAEYLWSTDGHAVFYTLVENLNQWYRFDVSDRSTSRVDSYEVPLQEIHEEELAKAYGLPEGWTKIAQSIERNQVIYTLAPEGQREGDYVLSATTSVFLKTEGDSESIFLGSVEGSVNELVWMPDNRQVLIIMGWSSEVYLIGQAYFWVVDIPENTLRPLLPIEESPPLWITINPRGGTVVYYTYDRKVGNFYELDLQAGTRKLFDLHIPAILWWLPQGEDHFLGIGDIDGAGVDRVFYYQSGINQISPVATQPVSRNIYAGSPLPSPDFHNLLFMETEGQHLSVITLCLPQ